MSRVTEKYNRIRAEQRFAHVYEIMPGDRCTYCGISSDGRYDHQPPVYVLHRFGNGKLVTKRQIREAFGQCKLVPCCTICNMGLGAYHGSNDNDRREEIVNWFLIDERYPEDAAILRIGERLIEARMKGIATCEIYQFPGVGRVIYATALIGMIERRYNSLNDFLTG